MEVRKVWRGARNGGGQFWHLREQQGLIPVSDDGNRAQAEL